LNISKDILGTKLLKNTNRKLYPLFRIVPLSMTLSDPGGLVLVILVLVLVLLSSGLGLGLVILVLILRIWSYLHHCISGM